MASHVQLTKWEAAGESQRTWPEEADTKASRTRNGTTTRCLDDAQIVTRRPPLDHEGQLSSTDSQAMFSVDADKV
jgi:hypothetical protein